MHTGRDFSFHGLENTLASKPISGFINVKLDYTGFYPTITVKMYVSENRKEEGSKSEVFIIAEKNLLVNVLFIFHINDLAL